ncbi:MAG: hypothetical protein MZV63_22770 [Marinilabiliales bacterium]|nr:hypothetical protein [Marinilabiliales bacterium]
MVLAAAQDHNSLTSALHGSQGWVYRTDPCRRQGGCPEICSGSCNLDLSRREDDP